MNIMIAVQEKITRHKILRYTYVYYDIRELDYVYG